MGYTVHPGNEHDSRTFKTLYDKIKKFNPEMIAADSAYKTPAIAKLLIDDNIKPLLPYKRPMTKEGFFKKYEYVYDEYHDCYLCPENKVLTYSTTNRDGYREYKSSGCANCPCLEQCTQSKDHVKVITRHIWEDYIEQCEDIRHGIGNKEIYNLRKETIERIFASAKEDHGFRYTRQRGKAQMNVKAALTFACMNLKKLAKMLSLRAEKEKEKSLFPSSNTEKSNRYLTTEKWVWSTCSTPNFVYSLRHILLLSICLLSYLFANSSVISFQFTPLSAIRTIT